MKAIILAAGRGSRMGSMTSGQPKCRTVLNGRELIDYQLSSLFESGIKDISVVTGYLSNTFDFDLHYFHNNRWKDTNMVSSLRCASNWLKKNECIVSYSDIVYSVETVKKIQQSAGDIVITYDVNWKGLWSLRFEDPLRDAETFKLKENIVIDIGRKTFSYDEIQGQFMGLIKFTPKGWREVEKCIEKLSIDEVDKLDMTALLQKMIHSNIEIVGVPIKDQWFEVDTESDSSASAV